MRRSLRGRAGHARVSICADLSASVACGTAFCLVECRLFVAVGGGAAFLLAAVESEGPPPLPAPRAALACGLPANSMWRNLAAAIVRAEALLPAHSGGRHHHDQRKRFCSDLNCDKRRPDLRRRWPRRRPDRPSSGDLLLGQVELPNAGHGHGCLGDAVGRREVCRRPVAGRRRDSRRTGRTARSSAAGRARSQAPPGPFHAVGPRPVGVAPSRSVPADEHAIVAAQSAHAAAGRRPIAPIWPASRSRSSSLAQAGSRRELGAFRGAGLAPSAPPSRRPFRSKLTKLPPSLAWIDPLTP